MKRNRGLPTYPGSGRLHGLLVILIVLEALAIIAQATFLAQAITFLFERTPLIDVGKSIVLFFVAFVLRYVFIHIQTTLTQKFASKTGTALRRKLIQSYFKSGIHFIQTEGTGRLVTLAVEGINYLKEYLEIISVRTLKSIIIPMCIVIYVFMHDKISSLILVVAVPIIIIFMILLGLAAEKMADRQYATYRLLSNHFIDSMQGLETLKYLGQSKRHGARIRRVSDAYRQATMRTLRVAFLSSFALDFFTSLSIAFVAVGLGFRLIDGSIVLLPALTILILAPEYFLPIKQVGKDFHATLDGQLAKEQIETIIYSNQHHLQVNMSEITWSHSSTLELKAISFKYTDKRVLDDITFSIKGTGMIGIVGASGSGKSTLIHLLTGRIAPNEGTLLLNGKQTNLVDEQWHRQIAYIPQHPYIFPTSLADNIRFYAPDATDEDILQTVKEIGLHAFVNDLPKGIHEQIGEGGRTLSGGEEQRIAMARAMLSERPIILLDEPTAHLDIETEHEIKHVMLHLFKNKTVFLATHRLHWMHHMDRLLVMDNGRLIEQGTHGELINQSKIYKGLHKGHLEGADFFGKMD